MSPSANCPSPGTPHPANVEIRQRAGRCWAEGLIEQVRSREGAVEVDLLLSDGTDATARLAGHEWDWLELQAGDIVPIRRLESLPCQA